MFLQDGKDLGGRVDSCPEGAGASVAPEGTVLPGLNGGCVVFLYRLRLREEPKWRPRWSHSSSLFCPLKQQHVRLTLGSPQTNAVVGGLDYCPATSRPRRVNYRPSPLSAAIVLLTDAGSCGVAAAEQPVINQPSCKHKLFDASDLGGVESKRRRSLPLSRRLLQPPC